MRARPGVPRLVVETPAGALLQWLCLDDEDSWRLVAALAEAFTPEALAGTTWVVRPVPGEVPGQQRLPC